MECDGRLLECGISADGWIEAYIDGKRAARDLSIGQAPRHNLGEKYTRRVAAILLTEAEAEKLMSAMPSQAAVPATRETLAWAYNDACYRVRKSFESENTCAQGPAFAERERAGKALAEWDAAHPEYFAEKKAEADVRHSQSFLARGLD